MQLVELSPTIKTEPPEKGKQKDLLRRFVSQPEGRFTGLDLMIAWTRHRLVEQRIHVASVKQALRLVLVRSLFWYAGCADLICWDDEGVEILIAEHLLQSNTNPLAQRRTINLVKRIGGWTREQHEIS